jgi:hypothetical protein
LFAANEIKFNQAEEYRFNIDVINFFPITGTTFINGEDGRRTEKGLRSIEQLLRQAGYPISCLTLNREEPVDRHNPPTLP